MKKIRLITLLLLGSLIASQGTATQDKARADNPQVDADQVRLIITDQIEAFIVLDVDRAYVHAAPSIKKIFPTSEIFGAMVKNSYPMIWNPKTFEFLGTKRVSDGLVQRVMFTDHEGTMHFFDYAMKQSLEKRWVISGVYMVQGKRGV